MSLAMALNTDYTERGPRASGDEPHAHLSHFLPMLWSPRERG